MKADVLQQISTGNRRLRLHLLGVAGSGMSGLAGLLLQLGHDVSGSDRVSSDEIKRLQSLGLKFSSPHSTGAVAGCDGVIYSSAIKPGNVAYDAALSARIPLIRRAEALAAIVRRREGVIVAGTHGKTTTSSLAAHVLRLGGLHPGHYVGAEIPILGTNAHWDESGRHFIAEGDESDGTLVEFTPAHVIILNIEEEHLDHYKDWEAIAVVFRRLCAQTSGMVIYCADDEGARAVCAGHAGAVSYACDTAADYRTESIEPTCAGSRFAVIARGKPLGTFTLGVVGRHNVSNALAVIALATELGITPSSIQSALAGFSGARRRFESRFRSARFQLVDDYGHHPTEIRATLAAARSHAPRRVLCLFQPHRYSRTQKLRGQFASCFDQADLLWVADIYAASESPIAGVDGGTIATAVNDRTNGATHASYVPSLADARLAMGNAIRPGDLALTLGAGNVHECARPLARDLAVLDALIDASGEPDLHARLYEPMRKHTTLRVGGPAQFWIEPAGITSLVAVVNYCRATGLPFRVVGRGSNLLVRDGGIPGVVIHPVRGEFASIQVDGACLRAGVGVRAKALAWAAREAGIGGFEWLEGIPGNVGGCLRMNAGAMGLQTFDQVESVLVLDPAGSVKEVAAVELGARYRSVPALSDNIALAATFRGRPDTPVETIDKIMAGSRRKRELSQPVAASAGCFFKNADEIPAGLLIDQLGLKGMRSGAAVVSDVHGNFLVNEGGASARDFLMLIEKIKRKAAAERNVRLDTEVQIIGEEELLF